MEKFQRWWHEQHGLRRTAPVIAVVVLVLWYLWTFSVLVWNRHERFGTFDYDLGMYDQGIWQTAHARNFMTTRGMNLFGHHANIGFVLFVPFYWIGLGGPHLLNVANTVAVVAVSVPIFLFARTHFRSHWAGFWLVVVYLFHFSTQWKIQETFHAESFAAPGIAFALYFASIKRWRWYWLSIATALIWKEDIALATAMLGVVVGVTFRQPKVAALTVGMSLVWFVVATELIMGSFTVDSAVYDSLFGPLGQSATDAVQTSLRHPSRLLATVNCHGAWDGELRALDDLRHGVMCPTSADVAVSANDDVPRGLVELLGPLGGLALLSPAVVLIGLPQHIVNYATTASFTWDLRWHYAFIPFIAVMLGAVWAVVRQRRAWIGWTFIVVMVTMTVMTSAQGVGPWTAHGLGGYWPLTDAAVNERYREAIAGIDDDAAVSVQYFLVPHLSQRREIYTFPNPWVSSNYGAGGDNIEPPDPSGIDVVVVNRSQLNPSDRALFDEIVASGDFEVTYHHVSGPERKTDLYRLERLHASGR